MLRILGIIIIILPHFGGGGDHDGGPALHAPLAHTGHEAQLFSTSELGGSPDLDHLSQ